MLEKAALFLQEDFPNAASTNLSAPPQPLHAIPAQGHPAQLLKALRDVEVHKRGHFVEPHVVPLCVPLSIFLLHLGADYYVLCFELNFFSLPVC